MKGVVYMVIDEVIDKVIDVFYVLGYELVVICNCVKVLMVGVGIVGVFGVIFKIVIVFSGEGI